jgi:hypothetical protein
LFIDLISRRRQWMLHGVLQCFVIDTMAIMVLDTLTPVACVSVDLSRPRILFERVAVDGVDLAVGRGLAESGADTGHRRGDPPRYLSIDADQLRCASTDIAGEGLRSGLASGPLCRRPARHSIGDRKVFAHFESRGARIFDGVSYLRTGRFQFRGTAARDRRGLL